VVSREGLEPSTSGL